MTCAIGSRLVQAAMVLGMFSALVLVAQEDRNRTQIKINKLEFGKVPTPYFRDATTHSSAKSERQWLQVFLEFESQGGRKGWADQITVEWALLVRPPDAKPMLLKESTVYVDVEAGKNRVATFVRPNFIRRYCDTKTPNESHFAAYVEISVDGRVLARQEYNRSNQPKNWWRAKEPDVRLVADELVPLEDTPFAQLDYDFYEHPKRKRQ
jgi:hypothetical protein